VTGASQYLLAIQKFATPSMNRDGRSETEYLKSLRSTPVNSNIRRSSKSLEMRQIWTFSANSATIAIRAAGAGHLSVAENAPRINTRAERLRKDIDCDPTGGAVCRARIGERTTRGVAPSLRSASPDSPRRSGE